MPKSADYLVQVKAQVMTLDDSIGGWVPMGGGGMSIVGLRKFVVSNGSGEDVRHEYLIHGQRITDQSVVLNCVLQKDVQYTVANPTFHHWKTEEKKFGLTFQSSNDARAFDKGVRRAVEDLLEGTSDAHDIEVGDDEVFMTIDLPLGRKDSSSQSGSTVSTTTSSPTPQSPALSSVQDPFVTANFTHHPQHPATQPNFHRITYIPRQPRNCNQTSPQSSEKSSTKSSTKSSESNGKRDELWPNHANGDKSAPVRKVDQGSIEESVDIKPDDSYVQFAKKSSVHEYTYPTLDSISKPTQQTNKVSTIGSQKKHIEQMSQQPPLLPEKKKRNRHKKDKQSSHLLVHQRIRCVYCNEMFEREDNQRGSCEDAPDRVAKCIEKVSCICCARGMLYHCMADADGDYGHPCVCDRADETNCKKWTALTILSFFVPCLWCYWPLIGCHRCGVSCGCCGGRHKAA